MSTNEDMAWYSPECDLIMVKIPAEPYIITGLNADDALTLAADISRARVNRKDARGAYNE